MRQILDKFATSVLRFIPALLALITPLFFLTNTPDFFSFNKQYFIYALASVSLIVYLLRSLVRGKIHLTLSPSLVPALILVITYVTSSIYRHPNPQASLFGPAALISSLVILFITISSTQKNETVLKSTIFSFIISGVLLSLVAILHYFDLLNLIFTSPLLVNKNFTLTGSPLYTLIYLLPLILSTLAYSLVAKDWIVKPTLFAATALMIIGAALSLKPLLPVDGKPNMILLPIQAGWSIAVDIFKNPKTALLGTGPDNFSNTFTALRPAYLNLNSNLWNVRFNTSTTEALSVLTTTGILGLLSYLLFLVLPLVLILRKIKNHLDPETVFLTTATVVTTLLFLGTTSSIVNFNFLFLLVTLLTIKLKLIDTRNLKDVQLGFTAKEVASANYQDLPTSTAQQIQIPVLPWIFTGLSAIILAVFWVRASAIYRAALAISQAAALIQSDPQASYQKQVEAANLDPYNPYYKINLSQTLFAAANGLLTKKEPTTEDTQRALGFAQEAINQAKASASLDPLNSQVWENFASIARQLALLKVQGASDWTLATYGQAISADPTNPTLRVQLGSFYYLLGDTDNAIKLMNQAIELKPQWNITYLNLAQIYATQKEFSKSLAYARAALSLTDAASADYTNIKDQISSLEKMIPANTPEASISAQPVQ